MTTKCFSLVLTLLFLLSACGGQQPSVPDDTPETQTVELTVWGAEEDQALLEQKFDYIFFTGGVAVGREVT